MIHKTVLWSLAFVILFNLISCANEFGSKVTTKPDERTHIFEAKEKIVLRAIASVMKEKDIGSNVTIDYTRNRVNSDYVVSGAWRTKSMAYVKRLNWKECEVKLSVTTEKKTEKGWEMRSLLKKAQFDSFFSVIDVKIYEEMSKGN